MLDRLWLNWTKKNAGKIEDQIKITIFFFKWTDQNYKRLNKKDDQNYI